MTACMFNPDIKLISIQNKTSDRISGHKQPKLLINRNSEKEKKKSKTTQ